MQFRFNRYLLKNIFPYGPVLLCFVLMAILKFKLKQKEYLYSKFNFKCFKRRFLNHMIKCKTIFWDGCHLGLLQQNISLYKMYKENQPRDF